MIAKYDKSLNDDDFFELIEPAVNEMQEYDIEFIHNYVAHYIYVYFKHDAIFDNETFDEVVRAALDTFANMGLNNIDFNKLNDILTSDYKLSITKTKPICIKEI